MSSPAGPPKRLASDKLAFTAFFTRSSQTPSQFHSPGRRLRPNAAAVSVGRAGSIPPPPVAAVAVVVVVLACDRCESEMGDMGEGEGGEGEEGAAAARYVRQA